MLFEVVLLILCVDHICNLLIDDGVMLELMWIVIGIDIGIIINLLCEKRIKLKHRGIK